ncbi:MAG: beta-lactamase family protein [Methanobacteriota archaeon]|nr:MAG: beta-lactamase family protein [Euryarchaeota archaeon]
MPIAEDTLDLLEKQLSEMKEAFRVPGLSLAITDRDRTLHACAMGVSDTSAGKEVTGETLFQIGSISKSFAAIVILQLRERGKVDLNAPVKEYLPWLEIKSRHAPITLHHLMTHTAGIPMGSEGTVAGETEVWELRNFETSAPPGEYFHYSNTGYKAVGLIIEAITGRHCGDAIAQGVLRPLGMTRTHATITNSIRASTATGYCPLYDDRPVSRSSPLAPAPWSESATADGSISSVPEDMASYIRMLLRRGEGPDGPIISEESYDMLTSRFVKPADSMHGEHYGYGFNVEDQDGQVVIGHTGGMIGFTSSLLANLDLGVGMVVLTNCLSEPEMLSRHALSTIRAAAEGRPAPNLVVSNHAYMPKDASEYVGRYSGEDGEIEMTVSDGRLAATVDGKKCTLEGIREDSFVLDHESFRLFPLKFTREAGQIVGVACGPEVYALESRLERDDHEEPPKLWDSLVGHYRSHNPWLTNFRVVKRRDRLLFVDSSSEEEPLTPLSDGSFRIGVDPRSPERIRFDRMIGGKAFVAYVSGGYYQRTFTP